MKKVWMFSSENDKNVKIAIRKNKWAYKKSTKTHGGIEIGDYFFLYSRESNNIMCGGLIKTLPMIGKHISIWKGETHWDWFKLDIKGRKQISLNEVKNILIIEYNMGQYCKLLFANSASKLTARDALRILSKMKG